MTVQKKATASKASSATESKTDGRVKSKEELEVEALAAIDDLNETEATVLGSVSFDALWQPTETKEAPFMSSEVKDGYDRFTYNAPSIRGIVVGFIPKFGAHDHPLLLIKRSYDGDIWTIGVNCNSVLSVCEDGEIISGKLKGVIEGDVIQINYLGSKLASNAKKGAKPYRDYEVLKF